MREFREERTGFRENTILGELVYLKCDNCNKWNSTFTHSRYFSVDCDCTLLSGKGRFRTTNLKKNSPNGPTVPQKHPRHDLWGGSG